MIEETKAISGANNRDIDSAAYKYWSTVALRFGDTDLLGHVNNAVYASLFESGRFAFCQDLFKDANANGAFFTLARLAIDFRTEMHFPGDALVGTRLIKVGRTSLTISQVIMKDAVCNAFCESVMVLVDAKERRPTPLTPPLLERLKHLAGSE